MYFYDWSLECSKNSYIYIAIVLGVHLCQPCIKDGIDRLGPERTNRSPSFSSSVGFPDGRRQVSSESQQSQGSQAGLVV